MFRDCLSSPSPVITPLKFKFGAALVLYGLPFTYICRIHMLSEWDPQPALLGSAHPSTKQLFPRDLSALVMPTLWCAAPISTQSCSRLPTPGLPSAHFSRGCPLQYSACYEEARHFLSLRVSVILTDPCHMLKIGTADWLPVLDVPVTMETFMSCSPG